ncbi:hypothetical protein LE181_01960 [Streptomyces sp. SCA3-4]|uniref:hypothetical protein n=1 Tax=Streptomyces sichuanensis TaxID=2871810 RepID=UPI001CE2C663|nr:hypothetical protein [Streptomyces sichuanensis]MCA6090939.1 hypothetical protein [Streptomyces sichuanensis]
MTESPRNVDKKPWHKRAVARVGVAIGTVIVGLVTAWAVGLFSSGKAEIGGRTVEFPIFTKGEGAPTLRAYVEPGESNGCEEGKVSFVYPNKPSDPLMNTPPGSGPRKNGKTWDKDPEAFGAVPAGPAWLSVLATSEDERAVIIKNIVFHVQDSGPRIDGTIVTPEGGCGDGVTYHLGRVDLSKAPPYWAELPDGYQDVRSDDLKFPYKASRSDPAFLHIQVDPGMMRRKWYAELYWEDGQRSGKVRLPEHGAWSTTPSKGLSTVSWTDGVRTLTPPT